ncbi:WD40 repeat-like protein, partial [Piedraia hortae CBS 480.64]
SNFFREARFSSDGTSIVTHNEDQTLRTFVLPTDLLQHEEQHLNVYSNIFSPSPIQSFSLYPFFNLSDVSTTVVLVASKDQPIVLRNALHYETLHASYSFIHPQRETYMLSYSLAFSSDGQSFVAGSKNEIAAFDLSRSGEGPVTVLKTAGGRRERKFQGMRCQGPVSALSFGPDGLLAAGTFEREVGLYSNGEFVTAFALPHGEGTGVTCLKWSPFGTHLIVAERQSDVLQVYDVRNTMHRVCTLRGREAFTTQRLGFDIRSVPDGYQIWAGGTDGMVRIWDKPGSKADACPPNGEFNMHSSSVSSTLWHPSCAVLATCSGQRLKHDPSGDGRSD